MPISERKLDSWVAADLNVLFKGKHGVGKSAIVLSTFQRHNLRYAYFSASTMDPWIDFVGIPTVQKCAMTQKDIIKFLRPSGLVDLNPQAMFFDELNRSHKKVRNAIMELTQFKTLNGENIFPDLRMIWGAINPDSDDDEDGMYDTDHLDPAQKDRFQVQVEIPWECDIAYFTKKFGRDNARAAIAWWEGIPEKFRAEVSPRRLDYALEWYAKNGDLSDMLPLQTAPNKLRDQLKHGSIEDNLAKWVKNNSVAEARAFLADANNFTMAKAKILTSPHRAWFYPVISKEHLSVFYNKEKLVREELHKEHLEKGLHGDFLRSLQNSNLRDRGQAEQLAKVLAKRKALLSTLPTPTGNVLPTPGVKNTVDAQEIILLTNQIQRGQGNSYSNQPQIYAKAMGVWDRTNLSALNVNDLRQWYMFVDKVTSGLWKSTAPRTMPRIAEIIQALVADRDQSHRFPNFIIAADKFGIDLK